MAQPTPPVCDYEGSDYQQTFWDESRAYEDAVEAVALRRLLPRGGRRMLELGAGAGRNTLRYKGFEQVVLLDYSLSQLQKAQASLGRSASFIYAVADVYRLPFVDCLFDAGTMIRTLHHLSDPLLALQGVRRVLLPGAVFILEYASKLNLKAILRYLLRRQAWSPFSLEPVEFARLNFDFHPAAVRAWLKQSGFALERQLTVSHFRVGWLKRLLPLRWLVGLDALLQHTGNWWQLSPSVFTRSTAGGEGLPAAAQAFFACPACAAPLGDTPLLLTCVQCGKQYPVQDGIYLFR